jgi:hypothetical protein
MTVEYQQRECIETLEAERSPLGDARVDLSAASAQAHSIATPHAA